MKLPRTLFDKKSLEKKRIRSGKKMSESFLFKEVVSELEERIIDSNRQYHRVGVVTGYPDFWFQHMPEAKVVRDEDILELKLVEYDLIINTLCLHWANDPIGQLIQCRRALRPDGLFLCAFLGGSTLNQLKDSLTIAESRVSGGLSNRFSPMVEIREAGNILQRAGFSLPVADNIKLQVSYKSIYHLIRDLRYMGETNSLLERKKTFSMSKLFKEANKVYQEKYKSEESGITTTFEIIFLAGWAPDVSQPKPLSPGSKSTPLSEILGSFESKK